MCNVNNHKSYGLGITAVTETRKHIAGIFDDVFVFLYQWLYDILRLVDI